MLQLDSEVLRKALFDIEENSYQNLCSLQNTMTNPLAIYTFENIQKELRTFTKDFNKKADLVFFTVNDTQYLKFSLAININTIEDRLERKSKSRENRPYITLKERGEKNRPTAEIFVDRFKIPDEEILITIFEAGIDLYVPSNYFLENSTLNILINKFNNNEPYFNHIIKNSTVDTFIVDVKNENIVLDNKNIKFYKNGLYLTGGVDYNLSVIDTKLYFNFIEDLVITDKIEIINSYHCIYQEDIEEKEDNLISFYRTIMMDLPISVDLIEFYIEGKRYFPRDLDCITPRHFRIKNFNINSSVNIRIMYNSKAITSKNNYTDDILQYFNFITEEEINDVLLYGTGIDVPDYMAMDKIPDIFPPNYFKVKNIDPAKQGKTYPQFIQDSLHDFISVNSNNLRKLINQYSDNNDFYFDITLIDNNIRLDTSQEMGDTNFTTFINPKVVINTKITKYTDFELLFFIDGVKVKQTEVLTFKHLGNTYNYLDYSLVENASSIRIQVLPVYNRNKKYIFLSINEDNINDELYIFNKSNFGIIKNIDDIFVMKKLDDGFSYQNGDYILSENEPSINIVLNNKSIGDIYIIYNSLFFDKFSIENSSFFNEYKNICIYDNYDSNNDIYLPRMSNYTTLVFVSGRELLEGLDFYVSKQKFHPEITKSKLIFKNIPDDEDWIEVFCVEQFREKIDIVDYVESIYGLIFFRKLAFPISLNYLDIYVNGKKVAEDDIELISDKIIRICNFDEINDVAVFSKIKLPSLLFQEFFDTYKDNPSLWQKWLEWAYLDGYLEKTIDEWYKEVNPEIQPLPGDPTIEPIFRFDALINLIAQNLLYGIIPRKLDANINLEFLNNIEYIELMEDPSISEVPLNPNKYNIFYDVKVDCDGTLIPIQQVIKIIINAMLNGDIPATLDINRLLLDYYNSNLENEVYPEELSLLNYNYLLDEDIIIDGNLNIQE